MNALRPKNPAGQAGSRDVASVNSSWERAARLITRYGEIRPNSEVRDNTSFGVLKFELYAEGYTWEFIPIRGDTFTDYGSDVCH